MEAIRETLQKLQVAITTLSPSPLSAKCARCSDTGVVLVTRQGVTYAKNCRCVLRRTALSQLSAVPPIFNRPKLSRLTPRADLHPRQRVAIEFVRSNPTASLLLVGKNGTGKSHIAWALYRHAVSHRRPVVACPIRDLIADYRRLELGVGEHETLKGPRVTADELRRVDTKPYFLFFDEFEKARPSEFASEQVLVLLDAARSYNHQVVITSNFTEEQLKEHWSRIDPVWGNSIMTRLEACHVIRLF